MCAPRVFFFVVFAQVGRSTAEAMAGGATAFSFSLQCACSLAYQFSEQQSSTWVWQAAGIDPVLSPASDTIWNSRKPVSPNA